MELIKKYFPYIIIAILLVVIMLMRSCTGSTKTNYDPQLHFNKIDSTYSSQMQIVSSNFKELKNLNDSLYQVVKTIKGQKETVSLTKIIIKTDTLRLPSKVTQYNDSSYAINWKYQRGSFQTLSGQSRFSVLKRGDKFIVNPDSTYINQNIYNLKLVTGIRKVKGKEEIFVKSLDPLAQVTELEGYRVERKKKRFNISVQVGYGATSTGISPYIGIGAGYKLLDF